ncbi:MAG TPA: alpha/beta hydrolase [Acidimicrobiia bacterium]|nr:alpha/beta hydrolase [Acidimicrobiia bacterium]
MNIDWRKIAPGLIVVVLALGILGLALTLRSDGGDDDGKQRASATTTTTTTTTTTGATTTTTAPPATAATTPAPNTVTPGTVVVLPTLAPPTTTPPPDTAASPDTNPATTTAPATTAPATTTTEPDEPVEDTRETVVYSPEGAPVRKANLSVPGIHRTTAIVLVHGGDGTRGSRRQMRAWAASYADAGYITLSIDHFLFEDETPPPVFPIPERDVKAAVQYLRLHAADLGIDPERIVVQGFGAGAQLGGVAYTTGDDAGFAGEGLYDDGTSDVANAFIGFYGIYDGMHADPDQYCGGPDGSGDADVQACYDLGDSVSLAAAASGPALLVHGDADTTVPPAQTTAFGEALVAAGIDATVAIVPGADHNFDRKRGALTPEGEAAFAEILGWLETRFPVVPIP